MFVWLALLLGLIQGIAEFLPISSSGHVAILQNLFRDGDYEGEHLLFDILLHFSTLIAIFAVYRKNIKEMLRDGVEYLRRKSDSNSDEPVALKAPGRALLFVIVGTLPLIPMAFIPAYQLFTEPLFIGFALIVTGLILFVTNRYIKEGKKTDKTMTLTDAIIIGLAQAVAVMPGLSRSGTTISVGLARGLTGSFAVRFSLLLSVPAVMGATIMSIFRAFGGGASFAYLPAYLVGFVVAAVFGFFAIQILRRIVAKRKLGNFAYYCWGIGLITIIWSFFI